MLQTTSRFRTSRSPSGIRPTTPHLQAGSDSSPGILVRADNVLHAVLGFTVIALSIILLNRGRGGARSCCGATRRPEDVVVSAAHEIDGDDRVHPRPQLVRPWVDLSGAWAFEYDDTDVGRDEGWPGNYATFSRTINVPYPPGQR